MEHIESYPPVNEDMFAEDDSLDTSLPGAQYVQTNVGVERS